ncbi:RNA-directed DNA polymerase, eukaryota, partial [Tanacetum coccineum]
MDIVHEINVLKNQDLYPRIYALETCKFVKVGTKLTQSSLDFSFRRKPRGGIEQEQYEALLVQVQDVNLVPVSDRWKWSLENSGDFSVASVRKMLDDKMLPDVTTKTRWIKLVPIKVNVHAWKVKIDSLPTRFNISRRGMDIESITCSICDNEVESSSHLFFKCNMVRDIIRKITRWWDITYIEADSYEDWLNWLVNLRLSSNYKQALEGVFYVMWWHVWQYRNKYIFEAVSSPKAMIFEDIVFMMLREDFCLITGFRFGKVSLDPKEEDHSEFLLRSASKGISNSKSVHTRVRTEVHQEVHVRTEVHRFVDIEEVRTLFVDEEDVQKRVVLAKTVKEQEQMIVDLQRRLYSVKQIIKQLHTGPSDVDLLDKNDNHSHNVPVGGLDHQSMEGVSQCMNDDQNCNNVPDNFPVDGPEYQSVEGVSQCTSVDHVDKKSFVMDDPEFKAKDNEEGSYSDTFLSTQQDVGVSESMNVDQPSLNTVVKDVKTVVVPFQRHKLPGKACVSPYVPSSSTEVKCKKRHRVMKLDNPNIVIRTLIGPDGNEIPLLPWKDVCVYKLRQ